MLEILSKEKTMRSSLSHPRDISFDYEELLIVLYLYKSMILYILIIPKVSIDIDDINIDKDDIYT